MPEFPEVYVITKDLNKILRNKIIAGMETDEKFMVLPDKKEFIENVRGKKILKVDQIAKNIIFVLEDNLYINIHLAMSGQILIKKINKKLKWERVTFTIKNKEENFYVAYRSVRMFGKVGLLDQSKFNQWEKKFGPSPLAKNLNPRIFRKIVRSKNTNIKNLLMDQTKIGGLGNIYATDALFLARVHPKSRTPNIPSKKLGDLLQTIKQVVEEGIKNRGSTLKDKMYVDIFGKKGKQQEYFKIYGRKTCISCGGKVKTEKISGRNSYFCPKCQVEYKEKELF